MTMPDTPSPSLGLGSPATVRVFTCVLQRGPISRREIAGVTGLSAAAVTKAVTPLVERGLVLAGETVPGTGPGRPMQPVDLDENAGDVIGVLVRPDALFGVRTTLRARVRRAVQVPLPGTAPEQVLDALAGLVTDLREGGDVLGVGLALSGDVDGTDGVVRESARYGWRDVALAEPLARRLRLPVVVDNDVRALTVAEDWFGVGTDSDSFAIVTIGTGIGCGMFVNGDVVQGERGVAGELGHLPLGDPALRCGCGRLGCLETVAASAAVLDAVRTATGDPGLDLPGAIRAARAGDPGAGAVFAAAGEALGAGLATVANLVGPGVILVAGESVADFDLFEESLRRGFDAHAFGAVRDTPIRTRSHTFENWARGAAASLIRRLVTGPTHDGGLP